MPLACLFFKNQYLFCHWCVCQGNRRWRHASRKPPSKCRPEHISPFNIISWLHYYPVILSTFFLTNIISWLHYHAVILSIFFLWNHYKIHDFGTCSRPQAESKRSSLENYCFWDFDLEVYLIQLIVPCIKKTQLFSRKAQPGDKLWSSEAFWVSSGMPKHLLLVHIHLTQENHSRPSTKYLCAKSKL